MSGKGFGVLGVTSPDGKLAGIVTDGDLRRYLTSGKTAKVIDDVMNRTRSPLRPISSRPTCCAS
jgi:arabinose-5-phosphate isomerase